MLSHYSSVESKLVSDIDHFPRISKEFQYVYNTLCEYCLNEFVLDYVFLILQSVVECRLRFFFFFLPFTLSSSASIAP